MPWLPSGLEQRVARAARPGGVRGWGQTYIPCIRGAGIEHIVSILSPRGAEHHAVLDSFEVVAANQLELSGGMPVPDTRGRYVRERQLPPAVFADPAAARRRTPKSAAADVVCEARACV